MDENQRQDAVDLILKQWTRERPDLDVTAMGTVGRMKRSGALLQRRLEQVFNEFNMSGWEFDVLATLRRSGPPYCLAPTVLFSALMVTSGTMTHRMQRLESAGLVERVANPEDARSKLVQLTAEGLMLIDKAVEAHTANMTSMLEPLSKDERDALDKGLSALLRVLDE
ncbi:MarR family transcriptional regulator [Pontibacterium granulatum]|uniref:MarR family winged helix-turn-helix transcriptional regulator n=1 Tax=Pontibacterium granulatum TaxID=2036029 RepID=UPI002499F4A6|nr:MarR family transcriptional regulator [Pontibacterium granulatum]MDI3326677.1 MarR family transcriptional regulator [Pontibacterium granulatum]